MVKVSINAKISEYIQGFKEENMAIKKEISEKKKGEEKIRIKHR